jgi:PAS domain S-box-containing protein
MSLFIIILLVINCLGILVLFILRARESRKPRNNRKISEESLRESEETTKLIMNAALDAIICIDPDGRIIVWTPQAENIFGWTENEVLGTTISETIIPFEYRQRHAEGLARYVATGEARVLNRVIEISALHKNGKVFPIELSIVPIRLKNRQYFCGFIRDITERKKWEEELKHSYSEIRELTEYLQNIREDERSHIAREIHDELGQQLTVLKMDVSWLNKKIDPVEELVREKLIGLNNMLDNTVKAVRRITSELRPGILDDLGLVPAMEWHLQEFSRRTRINTEFHPANQFIELPDNIKTGLYRIFQESLTNVSRHAKARNVTVDLRFVNDHLNLTIADDGCGFELKEKPQERTLGLIGMRERTQMMGGIYVVKSKPGEGTTVKVTVPVKAN